MTVTNSTRTVSRLKRLQNSVNGNPRYRVTFTDGSSALTKTDAGFAYAMTIGWEGQRVTVTIERGVIVDLEPFTSCDGCLAPVAKGSACKRCSA